MFVKVVCSYVTYEDFLSFFFVKSVNLITISGWWRSSHPNVIAGNSRAAHGHVVCIHGPISVHSRSTHGPILVGHGPSRAQGHLVAVHGPSRSVHGPSKWAGRHHIFGTFLQCFFFNISMIQHKHSWQFYGIWLTKIQGFFVKFESVLGDDRISFVVSLFQKQILIFLFWVLGFFFGLYCPVWPSKNLGLQCLGFNSLFMWTFLSDHPVLFFW